MTRIDILKLAFKNFSRRKARSVLTILGVVIGTMAVVIMISIGQGLSIGYEQQVSQWGNLTEITVQRNYGDEKNAIALNNDAVTTLQGVKNVKAVMAMKSDYMTFINGKEVSGVQINAIDPSQMGEFGFDLHEGRLLEAGDKGAVVMGYSTMFNFNNPKKRNNEWLQPMDENGNPNPMPFNPLETVLKATFDNSYGQSNTGNNPDAKPAPKPSKMDCVGVLKPAWNEYSYSVFMDYDTYAKMRKEYDKSQGSSGGGGKVIMGGMGMAGGSFGNSSKDKENLYDQIKVKVDDRKNVVTVQDEIKKLGFQAYSSMDDLNRMKEQAALIQMVLGGIGAIAFLVAALGITNTMVMSTYERTREIGIMKVMGCKLGNIRDLFLTEACIIGLLGGIVGVLLSFGVSFALNQFAGGGGLFGGGGFGVEKTAISIIPFWLVLCGILFTTLVGLISGFYPARRAMRLSALDAIKND